MTGVCVRGVVTCAGLPVEFKTFCRSRQDPPPEGFLCSGLWSAEGGVLTSGSVVEDNVEVVLQLNVDIVKDGTFSFSFRADAEPMFDGFYVTVDGGMVMPLKSYQFQYLRKEYKLTPGVHVIEFVYSKDSFFAVGEDRAWIRDIEVVGTDFNDPACSVCPPGTYSTDGSSACLLCPADHYSSAAGSQECLKCSDTQFSAPGSSSCTSRPECSHDDWYPVYGQCEGATRLERFLYKQPRICIGGLPLPIETQAPCAPCESGTERSADGPCRVCPVGTASAGDGAPCERCPAGTAARPDLVFDHDFRLETAAEPGFKIRCDSGYCSAGGWRMLGTRMDSGTSNSKMSDSVAELVVTVPSGGIVEFNYSAHSLYSYNRFKFFVDSSPRLMQHPDNDVVKTFHTVLEPGTHILTWMFHKEGSTDTPEQPFDDKAIVYYVRVSGVTKGGSRDCTPCREGWVSAGGVGECSACPKGFVSNEERTQCVPCPEGTFQPKSGGSHCIACGTGLWSEGGSAQCGAVQRPEITCGFVAHSGRVYDTSSLSKLAAGGVWGGLHDSRGMDYFITLCGDTSNLTDSPCVDHSGRRIDTPACQVTTSGFSYSIGRYPAFVELEDGLGFHMSYWWGVASRSAVDTVQGG